MSGELPHPHGPVGKREEGLSADVFQSLLFYRLRRKHKEGFPSFRRGFPVPNCNLREAEARSVSFGPSLQATGLRFLCLRLSRWLRVMWEAQSPAHSPSWRSVCPRPTGVSEEKLPSGRKALLSARAVAKTRARYKASFQSRRTLAALFRCFLKYAGTRLFDPPPQGLLVPSSGVRLFFPKLTPFPRVFCRR